jgi:hypothetical protein
VAPEDPVREVIPDEEKPLKGGPGKRGARKAKAKGSMKGAMVHVLGQASAAMFACVAMVTGHDHWLLEQQESSKLGEALDRALATLPERAYEKVIEISDKWAPWVQLTFVLGVILWDRVEQSAKLVEESNYRQAPGSAEGPKATQSSQAQSNHRPYHSSLGYDN